MQAQTCGQADEIQETVARVNGHESFAIDRRLSWRVKLRHLLGSKWRTQAHCEACRASQRMAVILEVPWEQVAGRKMPLWRESLQCGECKLIARQRYVAGRLLEAVESYDRRPVVYLTEEITHFYQWATKVLGERCDITGSEYVPEEKDRELMPVAVRHEDVEALSFEEDSVDIVVTNHVLEHVPNPRTGLAEFFRVLRPGGHLILSIPFDHDLETSRTRAELKSGELKHLRPAQYHGNPVPGTEGSLVFTDFGRDVYELLRGVGFRDVGSTVYRGRDYGYLGPAQVLFQARR